MGVRTASSRLPRPSPAASSSFSACGGASPDNSPRTNPAATVARFAASVEGLMGANLGSRHWRILHDQRQGRPWSEPPPMAYHRTSRRTAMNDLSVRKNLAPYKLGHKVRFVTAAALFDGHDASINI